MPRYTPDEKIKMLANAGLLTERQAEIYVYRRIEATPRPAVADELGIAKQTVSNTATRAGEIIDAAEATLDALDEIRHQVPDECAECGTRLGGKYVTPFDSDEVYCLACGGLAEEF